MKVNQVKEREKEHQLMHHSFDIKEKTRVVNTSIKSTVGPLFSSGVLIPSSYLIFRHKEMTII